MRTIRAERRVRAPGASSALTVRARDAHRALPGRRHTLQPQDRHIALYDPVAVFEVTTATRVEPPMPKRTSFPSMFPPETLPPDWTRLLEIHTCEVGVASLFQEMNEDHLRSRREAPSPSRKAIPVEAGQPSCRRC